MANIKELKKRIKSTKNTDKITSAMKLVSAAKLARAQHAIQSARPYANELEEMIRTISALVQNYEHTYLKETKNKHAYLLVISSNKGLCGSYNSGLGKMVKNFIKENQDYKLKVFFIGKKVKDLVGKECNLGKLYEFAKVEPSFKEIQEVAAELGEAFSSGEVGKVFVGYNVFKSIISSVPTVKQVLPMSLSLEEKEKVTKNFPFDFKYDPNPGEILDTLIPDAYITTIWTSILDANAAEHGSRMASMDSASRNCKDIIRTLTLKMNKLRQAAITTELIEVVAGAESLNG